jgi:hypothetical protein
VSDGDERKLVTVLFAGGTVEKVAGDALGLDWHRAQTERLTRGL